MRERLIIQRQIVSLISAVIGRGNHKRRQRVAQGKFRPRDSVLGDIVNSAPVYYGAPAKNVSGTGYSAFYSQQQNRKKAVMLVQMTECCMHSMQIAV
jgi:Tfp pilus tip-associated adhesin PilY1